MTRCCCWDGVVMVFASPHHHNNHLSSGWCELVIFQPHYGKERTDRIFVIDDNVVIEKGCTDDNLFYYLSPHKSQESKSPQTHTERTDWVRF